MPPEEDIPFHDLIVENTFAPNTENVIDVIDVPESDVSHFDRATNNQVGAGDMPALEESDISDTNIEVLDTINGQPAYEVDSVIGKRKSEFRRDGEPRVGGSRFWQPSYGYDYHIRWSTGETSWEPEDQIAAPEKVEEYETSLLQPPSASSSSPTFSEPSPSAEPSKESTLLTNICNFVHLQFFCFLSKLPFQNCDEWKNIKVPQSQKEAYASPEAESWIKAEKAELEKLLKNKTWKTFDGKKPPKKPITCRWVYKLKPPTTLQPQPIFKARLVAHGYKQKAYLDYGATFAQVATTKAMRIFIWLSVVFGYI